MIFFREVLFRIFVGIVVSSLIMAWFSTPGNATENERRIEALGILLHLACHTSSQEERHILENFGYHLDVDPLLDDRYPVRAALRDIQGPESLDWGARARQLFLKIGANPVTVHVALLELQFPAYWPSAVARLFTPSYLRNCLDSLPNLNILIAEFLESCCGREGCFGDLMGNMEIPTFDQVRDVQEIIDKVMDLKQGAGRQRSTRIIISPYLPGLTGFNAAAGNDERWAVIGPSPDDATQRMLLAHELLHVPVHALTNKIGLRWKIFTSRDKFFELQKAGHSAQGYNDWHSYVEEGIVRALSYEVAEIPCRNTGFLLERICQLRLSGGDTGPLGLVSAITAVLDDAAI